jgi:pimeloyl-ACP methyl ester carboxylesterase
MTLAYRTALVDVLKVFSREAGDPKAPTMLLLHGFPTSSHMFRDLIPHSPTATMSWHPTGFGFTDAPDHTRFRLSFDHLAEVVERFTEKLGLSRYAVTSLTMARQSDSDSPARASSAAGRRYDLAERQCLRR